MSSFSVFVSTASCSVQVGCMSGTSPSISLVSGNQLQVIIDLRDLEIFYRLP